MKDFLVLNEKKLIYGIFIKKFDYVWMNVFCITKVRCSLQEGDIIDLLRTYQGRFGNKSSIAEKALAIAQEPFGRSSGIGGRTRW